MVSDSAVRRRVVEVVVAFSLSATPALAQLSSSPFFEGQRSGKPDVDATAGLVIRLGPGEVTRTLPLRHLLDGPDAVRRTVRRDVLGDSEEVMVSRGRPGWRSRVLVLRLGTLGVLFTGTSLLVLHVRSEFRRKRRLLRLPLRRYPTPRVRYDAAGAAGASSGVGADPTGD